MKRFLSCSLKCGPKFTGIWERSINYIKTTQCNTKRLAFDVQMSMQFCKRQSMNNRPLTQHQTLHRSGYCDCTWLFASELGEQGACDRNERRVIVGSQHTSVHWGSIQLTTTLSDTYCTYVYMIVCPQITLLRGIWWEQRRGAGLSNNNMQCVCGSVWSSG